MSWFTRARTFGLRAMQQGHCGSVYFEPTSDSAREAEQQKLKATIAVWAVCGCPTYTLTLKQASVFCSTSCNDISVDELIFPFPVFGVMLESALHPSFEPFWLVSNVGETAYRYTKWAQSNGLLSDADAQFEDLMHVVYVICASATSDTLIGRGCNSLVGLADDQFKGETRPVGETLVDRELSGRWLTASARITIAMLLSLDRSGKTVGSFSRKWHRLDERRGLAGYDEFRYTGPIGLDLHTAARDWIQHGGEALSVRSLVAGHWKLQPCGPRLSERKRIHISPYWRGPLDAPVAMRCPAEADPQ